MVKIKSLQVAFENCESLEVKEEHIEWLHFSGVTETYYHSHKSLSTYKVAQKSYVHIHTDVNSEELWMDKETSPLDRIMKCSDIVSFIVKFEDGAEQEFYVHWEGKDEYYNPSQKSKVEGSKLIIEVLK